MNLNRNLENLDIKIFQDFKKKNPTKSLCYHIRLFNLTKQENYGKL